MNKDIIILRDLAKQVKEIADNPIQEERRNLWRKHNSFNYGRPPIYVRAFAFNEIFNINNLKCEDPLFRQYEYFFHEMIFRDTIGDDYIIEPWINVNAVYDIPVNKRWGVDVEFGEKLVDGGAASYKPSIINEKDIEKLVTPHHKINESATKDRYNKMFDAVGDIITVNLDRGPMLRMWTSDISTDIAKLRGLEQIMWDAYDRPEWFHKLLTFMKDGILKVHEEAEKAGDWSLSDHQNQAMPYAKELKDPKPNCFGVHRKDLWFYMASQEYTTFGPELFEEFMLRYQIPIMKHFGLVSYGCCEDLTQKIDLLRKIPNLRRIAVTPFANAKKCSEQIGKDYVLSWRPNPSTMICNGLDRDYVRNHIKEHVKIFRENNNYFDITLKDVETIKHKPENVREWVKIVRSEIEK